jgi:hypothetical protein
MKVPSAERPSAPPSAHRGMMRTPRNRRGQAEMEAAVALSLGLLFVTGLTILCVVFGL